MPPHFHISTPYGEAMVRIEDLQLIKGRLRRRDLNRALEWARQNRARIWDCWDEQNG